MMSLRDRIVEWLKDARSPFTTRVLADDDLGVVVAFDADLLKACRFCGFNESVGQHGVTGPSDVPSAILVTCRVPVDSKQIVSVFADSVTVESARASDARPTDLVEGKAIGSATQSSSSSLLSPVEGRTNDDDHARTGEASTATDGAATASTHEKA
jgi:hypothetical protein